MKIQKKLVSKVLSVVLIAVVASGALYVGYNAVAGTSSKSNQVASIDKTSDSNMDMNSMSAENNNTQNTAGKEPEVNIQNKNQDTQMDTGSEQINNDQNSSKELPQSGVLNQEGAYNPDAIKQSAVLLQNKQSLSAAIGKINDAMAIMTADPYKPDSSGMENNVSAETMMQNMGLQYNVDKMAQLHTGLYRMAMGKMLLEDLNNKIVSQAEIAYQNTQSPLRFYTNQYNITVQFNNQLNNALEMIHESANLVNINPYVSADGLATDNARMQTIHQSVFKLAEGVTALNQLSEDFTTQAIGLANMVQANSSPQDPAANISAQNTANGAQNDNTSLGSAEQNNNNGLNNQAVNEQNENINGNTNTNHTVLGTSGQITDPSGMNQTADENAGHNGSTEPAAGSILRNVNANSIVNIILIVFVAGLILGIIGFIISRIKNSAVAKESLK